MGAALCNLGRHVNGTACKTRAGSQLIVPKSSPCLDTSPGEFPATRVGIALLEQVSPVRISTSSDRCELSDRCHCPSEVVRQITSSTQVDCRRSQIFRRVGLHRSLRTLGRTSNAYPIFLKHLPIPIHRSPEPIVV